MLVHVTINGKTFEEESSLTILQVARKHGIRIPTLCYLFHEETKVENKPASCRVCIVEVKGRRNLVPACATQIAEGMEVSTNNQRVINARRTVVELLLSNHPNDCLRCDKNGKCELQNLAAELGIREIRYQGVLSQKNEYREIRSIERNASKCILCNRCVTVCSEVQTCGSLSATERGFNTKIGDANKCVSCGQCIQACPTGALKQAYAISPVEKALNDPTKIVVVQTAPACRVSLGEEFGYAPGTDVTKKMVGSFKALGFKKVYDTNFSADLTIMEETTEFLNRYTKKENLPLFTSCCPGWVKFIEFNYPELLHLPSSCKSPMEMFGAIYKDRYAKMNGYDPKDVFMVALMPCVAKKQEAKRPELTTDGNPSIDAVLTVKEYAAMLKKNGIDLRYVDDEEFDNPLGESSGAADIFANTGGVIEAVARTASKWLGGDLSKVEFEAVRGLCGVREANVNIAGNEIKLCIVSGLKGAREVCELVKAGKANYDAIEIMACPGGCVNGGGQPTHLDMEQIDVIKARQAGIYNIDKNKPIRISCETTPIKELYENYLEKPGAHKAHELLHTVYHDSSDN